jgi:hypothetical protein
METSVSEVQPFWIPPALFVGCLAVIFITPLALFLAGRWLPDVFLWAALGVHPYVFPFEARRMPDLPAGMHPGPNFRYELGTTPVVLVWAVVTFLFGWLARGFKAWQTVGLAVLTIAVVTVVMHVALQLLGFRPNPTYP